VVTITPLKIEDYGLIGDGRSCALVGRNGSIDWLCWPRFDSPACFAALLGTGERALATGAGRGTWGTPITVTRSYRNHGMVLETVFETHTGVVAVLDFMAVGAAEPTLIRIVEGRRGAVPVLNWLVLRFDYGLSVPWVTRLPDNMGISAIAGPSRCVLRCPVALHGEDRHTVSRFIVSEGDQVPFVLTYMDSHGALSQPIDAQAALHRTEQFWADWIGRCTYQGEHASIVRRSLLTLKALIYQPTGGSWRRPQRRCPRNWGRAELGLSLLLAA
jgi:glucoamylase